MGRGVSGPEHLCWDVLAPVAVASLGGSQVWKETFTPRWPKVTPREGDRRQHSRNTHQVTMKCSRSWRQKQWRVRAARRPGWPVALLAPVPPCQPEGNPYRHHCGPAWPHSGSVTQDTSPSGQAEPGQPNPTPAKPSTEEGGGGGYCCQQLPPLPDPSRRAQPPHLPGQSKHGMVPKPCWCWVWSPSAGRALHCHLAMPDGAMLHVSPKYIPPLACDGCSSRPGSLGQTPA